MIDKNEQRREEERRKIVQTTRGAFDHNKAQEIYEPILVGSYTENEHHLLKRWLTDGWPHSKDFLYEFIDDNRFSTPFHHLPCLVAKTLKLIEEEKKMTEEEACEIARYLFGKVADSGTWEGYQECLSALRRKAETVIRTLAGTEPSRTIELINDQNLKSIQNGLRRAKPPFTVGIAGSSLGISDTEPGNLLHDIVFDKCAQNLSHVSNSYIEWEPWAAMLAICSIQDYVEQNPDVSLSHRVFALQSLTKCYLDDGMVGDSSFRDKYGNQFWRKYSDEIGKVINQLGSMAKSGEANV